MQEIERKFLLKDDSFKKEDYRSSTITQGYISTDPERTVRVRLEESHFGYKFKTGYLTIKGKNNESGVSRYEWETEMEFDDAEDLMKLCKPGVIKKIRYRIDVGKHTYEVDEFLNKNKGLIIAEIELNFEEEKFEKPIWLGEEVTGNKKYYNVNLK